MKKILVVDGNSILNRAFYGVRLLSTRTGIPTNALYGTVAILQKQENAVKPDVKVAAFDVHAPTFRHEIYAEYKAGRHPTPPELLAQMPLAKELLSAMGYTVLEKAGYEADDFLGTVARMGAENGDVTYLLTGDRDSLQLIDGTTHVLLATNGDTPEMDEDAFIGKYGVTPKEYIDVKALMGDASDHIVGVPGIGEKTAFALIAKYHTLENLYASLPNPELKPSVNQKLADGKISAFFSRKLATIVKDVPMDVTVDEMALKRPDHAEMLRLFTNYEFNGFIEKYRLRDGEMASASVFVTNDAPVVEKKEADVSPSVDESALCALWCEDGVWSLGDSARTVADVSLASVLACVGGRRVLCFDLKSVAVTDDVDFNGINFYDLSLADWLVNPSANKQKLSDVTFRLLGEVKKPSYTVYLDLYRRIAPTLTSLGEDKILFDIEQPLAFVLADMEKTGIRLDREGIAAYGKELDAVAAELSGRVICQAGHAFNLSSPKQLGEVLFGELGLPYDGKKKNGAYSTSVDVLEKLAPDYPIVRDLLDYRQVTKLKSTYVDGLLRESDGDGFVHTHFEQTGTVTGRLSSTEPNLQNIPVRTELGRRLRRYFLPADESRVLVDADYSQVELRIMASLSGDENMIRAFAGGTDIHRATAASVFGVAPEDVTAEMRKRAKAVNFGLMYGIGAYSLAEDLGISRREAKEMTDNYFAAFSSVKPYLDGVIADARDKGRTLTAFGRIRPIPELSSPNRMVVKFGERIAMNSPVQGTAADVMKIAMIRVFSRLKTECPMAHLLLQVHDELVLDVPEKDVSVASRILVEEMEKAADFAVPLVAEVGTGKTWFDAK